MRRVDDARNGGFIEMDCPARGTDPLVLVVDGDPVSRASLVAFFHRRGFEVAAAASGERALRALSSFRAKLCVLDWLPAGRMTGVEAAEAMLARDASLRFVFLSDWLEPTCVEQPACLRGAPLLHKPVDLDELTSVVSRELRLEKPSPPGPARRRAGSPASGGRGPYGPAGLATACEGPRSAQERRREEAGRQSPSGGPFDTRSKGRGPGQSPGYGEER